jgi:hypothetical protein
MKHARRMADNNQHSKLGLSEQEKRDLAEFLKLL